MPSNWLYILIAIVIGGAASTTIIMVQRNDPEINSQLITETKKFMGNPLLEADKITLDKWFAGTTWNCGAELYIDPDSWVKSECITQIKQRVATDTNIHLSTQDILDPKVASRWRSLRGTK